MTRPIPSTTTFTGSEMTKKLRLEILCHDRDVESLLQAITPPPIPAIAATARSSSSTSPMRSALKPATTARKRSGRKRVVTVPRDWPGALAEQSKRYARENLQLMLFLNLLKIAYVYPRQPDKLDLCMQESLQELHTNRRRRPRPRRPNCPAQLAASVAQCGIAAMLVASLLAAPWYP